MIQKTPLSHAHESLNARMVDFGGWYLPVQYEGIVAEHNAVRNACGIFDTCHMGRIGVKGVNSAEQLSAVLTVDAANMPDGRCRYGFMLNESGGIIDDLIVYRISAEDFMIVINSATHDKDLAHLQEHISDTPILTDLSSETAKIDVQGPESPAVLERVLGKSVDEIGYFRLTELEIDGVRSIISRTGYTGERGYEIYLPAESVGKFWRKALEAGAIPCGLGARDTLRLEAGLPLYGHEMSEDVTPLEAGFMRYIDLNREFIGADALRERQKSDPSIKLTPFIIEGRQSARHKNKVIIDNSEAGWVTSGSFAPSLGKCIGFAYIETQALGNTENFGIDNGRKILEAKSTKTPFYRR